MCTSIVVCVRVSVCVRVVNGPWKEVLGGRRGAQENADGGWVRKHAQKSSKETPSLPLQLPS